MAITPNIETYPESEVGWVAGAGLSQAAALVAAVADYVRNTQQTDAVQILEYHAEQAAWALKELGILEDFKRPDGKLSVTDTEKAREEKGLSLETSWRRRWKRQMTLEV